MIMTFHGTVDPLGLEINFQQLPRATWDIVELEISVSFEITIMHSKVTVVCTGDGLQRDHFGHVYKRAFDLASAVVNTMAFAQALGLTVRLEKVDFDGEETPIHFRNPQLEGLCTSFTVDGLSPVLDIVLSQPSLMLALHDLVEALKWHGVLITNCGRVVDSIRHLIAGPEARVIDGWRLMHEALNVDTAYLRLVTDASARPRHGDRVWFDEDTSLEILKRAWTIFDRYLHYRLGGGRPLSVPNFPPLAG